MHGRCKAGMLGEAMFERIVNIIVKSFSFPSGTAHILVTD
jgi:hypothetical protein